MRKGILTLLLGTVVVLAAVANADYYLAGEFNGWDAAGLLMTDNGDGTYSATVSGMSPNTRYGFKVTDGTWDWNYPGANSWLYTDDSGECIVTFNTNTVSDGWEPAQYRIGLSTDPGAWTIAGDFQGWDNANSETAMTSLGHGFYLYTLAPGDYTFKPVVTGSWDSISSDGRSEGTADYTYSSSEDISVYVDALTGTIGVNLDVADITRDYVPHDPDPNDMQEDVAVTGLTLSWAVAQAPSQSDPNVFIVDPNLVEHKLYMSSGSITDANLYYVDTVTGWDTETLRASYTPDPVLDKDAMYKWRVDMVVDDVNDIPGFVWTFNTELTTPSVTDPEYQVVDADGTAVFLVVASSPSPVTYQWYLDNGDGDTEPLLDTLLTGEANDTLTITNVTTDDEGGYYCVVNNDSGVPATSAIALLGVKRMIAHWDFELDSYQSTVSGSPASLLYHEPNIVPTGVASLGNGMQFDNDTDAQDILYTDPDEASYFDICNYSMTVGCWIKSGFAAEWGPMVARNGELYEAGWQLREKGGTYPPKACFTTRGTENEDSRATNDAVYDDQWHYVVATFDITEKKIYVDGVVTRIYSSSDGSIASEADTTGSLISASPSPVALGGRVSGDPINGLTFFGETVSPCILDEVEIYNYVRSATQIAQTYADITGQSVCPAPLDYDLNDDCKINLDDLGLLASAWLMDTSVE